MPTIQDALARAVEFLSAVPVQWRIVDARDEEPDKGARYDYEPTGLPLGTRAEATRYAWRAVMWHGDRATRPWRVVARDGFEKVLSYERSFDLLDYELRTIALAVTMPSWWTPEQRFAWRVWTFDERREPNAIGGLDRRDIGTFADYTHDVEPLIRLGAHTERITADLETGAEVPA